MESANQTLAPEHVRMSLAKALTIKLGFRPSPPTIWRWRSKGVNGVKLEADRCGRQWFTTLAKVDEFIRKQSEEKAEPPVGRTQEMEARLRAAGLL